MHQVGCARGAAAAVLQVRRDAAVAERVAARRDEGVGDDLLADGAVELLRVEAQRHLGERVRHVFFLLVDVCCAS